MNGSSQSVKVGVYVDVVNIARNGGYGMHYGVLREFACRGDAVPMRLNAYVSYDYERGRDDSGYRQGQLSFHDMLREQGFKVIVKTVKWYTDDSGNRFSKANADLDLAVDALLQSQNIDRVLLATGDGDFVQVVKALQNKGCRVEAIAFENVSSDLRREADMFMSGYLVPGLLPMTERGPRWGEVGSRVRGTCYHFNFDRGFGFFRFLKQIGPNLWDVDSRKPTSPYRSSFFHESELPAGFSRTDLPSRDIVFEFELTRSPKAPSADEQDDLQATSIQVVKIG